MSQFKPGDSALVIGGNAFLGSEVEISQWISPGDDLYVGGRSYRLNDSGRSGWLVICGERGAIKLESHLMPLRGDFQPEQQKSREESA